jgi:hypothetical protein
MACKRMWEKLRERESESNHTQYMRYYYYYYYHHHHHNHHHHVGFMGVGQYLTRSVLTHPEVSSVVFPGSLCIILLS